MTGSPYIGRCLCGKINYEVDQIESQMAHCHCTMCRKFHGAAYATYGEAKAENFRWTQGEDMLERYHADNGTVRSFCRNCGSSMTFTPSNDDGSVVEFSLGTLESPITHTPDAHVFLNYKAPWVTIDDDLPKFEEGRNSPLLK